MQQHYDVLIVGGGIVGMTAALAMASQGFTVAVIDAGPLKVDMTATDSRVYAVNDASRCLFEQLGVGTFMDEKRLSPYQHMHVWDAKSQAYLDFDARMIAASKLGDIIEESVMKQALLQRIKTEKNIDCFPENTIKRVDCSGDLVSVSCDEHGWFARLLIIADGGESPVRTMLRVPITTWPYHQHALVATVSTEKSHQKTAFQVFNPEGPLAFLPLLNPHQCSIVWSTSKQHASFLTSCPEETFNQELEQAFQQRLGRVSLQTKRYQFPLIMRHTKRYAGKNWMLLGDAAHTIHPLAGLGLNVGLADVATWLSRLQAVPNHQWSEKILGAWQRERKSAVWKMIVLMDGLKTLFANPLPPIVALRGLGLDVCNRLTPVKRFLIEQAVGKRI